MSKFKTNEEYFQYAKTLSVIPTEDLVKLLTSHKLKFPLQVHRFVIKETIYSKVFQNQLYGTYTDEQKYRLRGYQDYSLYLLEKLMEDYTLDFDAAKYKEVFFNLLFLNRGLYNLKDGFFAELDKLKYKYAVDYEKINYATFKGLFLPLFYEQSGFLDGVSLKILKEVLVHSSTLGDLRGLGEKYNVKVPRRINKIQLIEILASRFRLTQDEASLLNSKSVLELEIYAKEKGFKISIDLKKSDMVEYILYALDMFHIEYQKDLHDYNVPRSEELDSVKIEDANFVVFKEEDIAPTTVLQEEDVEVAKTVLPTPAIVEQPKQQPIPEPLPEPKSEPKQEPKPEPKQEPKPEPKQEPKPEPKQEPKSESKQEPKPDQKEEPKPEPKPEKREKAKPEPKAQKEEIVPIKVDVEPIEESRDVSVEEQDLLDEKIRQIIRKYKKSRRVKVFWTTTLIVLGVAILGFLFYGYLYNTQIDPGNWPFGLNLPFDF